MRKPYQMEGPDDPFREGSIEAVNERGLSIGPDESGLSTSDLNVDGGDATDGIVLEFDQLPIPDL